MNKAFLVGRLTRDPNVSYSNGQDGSQMAIARFTVAVDRRVKREANSGEQTADFISCMAFGKQGEFAEKYLKQGTKIVLEGRIQTGSYTNKDGVKVYTTDIVAEHLEFAESKAAAAQNGAGAQGGARPNPAQANPDGFMNIPDGVEDDGLPFN